MQNQLYTATHPCGTCGGPIRNRVRFEAQRLRYCSRACAAASLRLPRIPRICVECGASFTTLPSRITARNPCLYCSRACAKAAQSYQAHPEHFWEHVDRTGECWRWTGQTRGKRYGRFAGQTATRLAWAIATGAPPPTDLLICHTCDNPACVRNDDVGVYLVRGRALPRRGHLFLGTTSDNQLDCFDKGRRDRTQAIYTAVRRGEAHPSAKLTAAQVRIIRARYGAGERIPVLAAEYGVRRWTIEQAARRLTWRTVV